MAPKLNENGKAIVAKLAAMDEIRQAAKPPAIATTKDHYGHYAAAIDMIAGMLAGENASASGRRTARILAAESLRAAGGNGRGIDAAMSSMFGHAEYDPMASLLG